MDTNDRLDNIRNGIDIDRRTALKGLGAAGVGLTLFSGPVSADHSPADKVSAAGATLEVLETTASNGGQSSSGSTVTLLSGSMKTSSPTDLIFHTTLECALFTDIKTKGNDSSAASAGVTGWVEVDGEPVPVTAGSPGEVVFCNRDFSLKTSDFENEEATLELFLRTRSTHGFNWITTNVGSGEHTVELKAKLDVHTNGKGEAKALVGPRTMVVEPTKLANDASV